MKIQDFKETNPTKQSAMKEKLKNFKLENIHTIIGSKGY